MAAPGFPDKYTQLWAHTPVGDVVDDDSILPAGITVDSPLEEAIQFTLESAGDSATASVYGFLKTTGGAVNPAIVADIGLGDYITTAAYWENSDLGGATYRVVAAATGTDDGGSYIDAGTLQLQAVFGHDGDVWQFGAVPDATHNGTNWVGTDNSSAVQACLDWVPSGGTVNASGVILASGLLIDKNTHLLGSGSVRHAQDVAGCRFVAPSTSTDDYILSVRRATPPAGDIENHIQGVHLAHFTIDGNGRTPTIDGLTLYLAHDCYFEDILIFAVNGRGLWFEASIRESEFVGVETRYCGNQASDLASFDFRGTEAIIDDHNNLDFFGCRSVYGSGTLVHIEQTSTTSPIRGIRWQGGLIHGHTTTSFSPDTTDGLYTLTDAGFADAQPVLIADARGVFFTSARIHNPGATRPLVLFADSTVNGALTINRASFTQTSFGESFGNPFLELDGSTNSVFWISGNSAENTTPALAVSNPSDLTLYTDNNEWQSDGVGSLVALVQSDRSKSNDVLATATNPASTEAIELPIIETGWHQIEAVLMYNSPSAADFQASLGPFSGLATSEWETVLIGSPAGDPSPNQSEMRTLTVGESVFAASAGGDANDMSIRITGSINVTTPGTLRLAWAQLISDAGTTTLRAGSFLKATRVASNVLKTVDLAASTVAAIEAAAITDAGAPAATDQFLYLDAGSGELQSADFSEFTSAFTTETGVAVTAAGIHAALVNLGLITA